VALGAWLVWAAGVEFELPVDCVAKAELAIKPVATSAAANFVNIVFSLFSAPIEGMRANVQADFYD
jgi:hypothetical protein